MLCKIGLGKLTARARWLTCDMYGVLSMRYLKVHEEQRAHLSMHALSCASQRKTKANIKKGSPILAINLLLSDS